MDVPPGSNNGLEQLDGAPYRGKCFQFPQWGPNKGMNADPNIGNPFCPQGSDDDPGFYPINVVWPNSMSGAVNLCKVASQSYYPIFDGLFFLATAAIPISIGVEIRKGIQTPPFLYSPIGEDAP